MSRTIPSLAALQPGEPVLFRFSSDKTVSGIVDHPAYQRGSTWLLPVRHGGAVLTILAVDLVEPKIVPPTADKPRAKRPMPTGQQSLF